MDQPVVVGIGEVLWDLLPEGPQFGGAPANFAYHARSLGAEAQVVSCVGADELGESICRRLDDMRLGSDYVATDKQHPTGTVSVQLDEHGKPSYVIHEPVAWDFIPPLAKLAELAGRADAVCFGSLAQRSVTSRTTIRDFLAATRDECLRIFDVNLRQQFFNVDILSLSLAAATVLKLSDEELPVVCQIMSVSTDQGDVLLTLMRRFGLQLIALTKGDQGSELVTATERSVHPGVAAEVADTIGAGDSFTAALAMGLLHGLPLDKINERANQVAAYVCGNAGATPVLPADFRY